LKKKNITNIETLDMDEYEDDGFIEGDVAVGKSIASFNFNMNSALTENEIFLDQKPPVPNSNNCLTLMITLAPHHEDLDHQLKENTLL